MSVIIWDCETCETPICEGAGYAYVSHEEIARYEEASRAWRARTEGQLTVTLNQLIEHPMPVRWHIHHDDCRPQTDERDYWIGIDRMDTHRKMLDRTAHLLEKRWLKSTNWVDVIRKATA